MFAVAAREQDQSCAVGFETCHVESKGLNGEIGAARINADANGRSKFAGDFSFLYFPPSGFFC